VSVCGACGYADNHDNGQCPALELIVPETTDPALDRTISEADALKVIAPRGAFLALEQVLPTIEDGGRVYAYLSTGECAGQVVKVASAYYLDKYGADVQFYWTTSTTLADLVSRA
jgi:hypothetical protein